MPDPPKLLDRVRAAVRLRHLSPRTEKTYVAWIRRFVLFHAKRHPGEMGADEVTSFLSSLATVGGVSASTQNRLSPHCSFSAAWCSSTTCRGSTRSCARKPLRTCRS